MFASLSPVTYFAIIRSAIGDNEWWTSAITIVNQEIVIQALMRCFNIKCFDIDGDDLIRSKSYGNLTILIVVVIVGVVGRRYCGSINRYFFKWWLTINDPDWKKLEKLPKITQNGHLNVPKS